MRNESSPLPAPINGTSKSNGTTPAPTLAVLPVSAIVANPLQPRKTFDDEKMKDLIESVKAHGIVQPVIVTRHGEGYRLVVGERRWRAATVAGLAYIPALIQQYAEAHAMEVALVENIQRADLNPIEEAQAMQFLIKEYQMTQEMLAVRLGKSRPSVSNILRLLNLPREIQQDVVAGALSAGHARTLLALEDDGLRLRVWKRIKEASLSVRQTEDLVRRLQSVPRPASPAVAPPELADFEEDLQRVLQTDVKIRQKSKQRGRIEIAYASADELDRLLDALSRIPRRRSQDYGLDLL